MAVETVAEQKESKRKSRKSEDTNGEQLQLLEVSHPSAKKITSIARAYKKIVRERVELTSEEVELKGKLRQAVRETDMKPDAEGIITFKCGKITVTVTPRDELIRVKDEDAVDEG